MSSVNTIFYPRYYRNPKIRNAVTVLWR